MIKNFHTIICGSGPAGLAAAFASIRSGRRTLLLEKNAEPARKLLVSGSGKCNFSNTLEEELFMSHFGRSGRFMTDALRFFGRERLLQHLREQKVSPVVVDELYYFPASMKAADIRDAFLRPALESGLILKTQAAAKKLIIQNGSVTGVELADGTILNAQKVILATGGSAMPQLGAGTGGLVMAQQAGHKLTPPLPAMAPLFLQESWIKALSGISMPDSILTAVCSNQSGKSRGSLLFTHDGLSGMAAINLSSCAYRFYSTKPEKLKISVNFCADKSRQDYIQLLEHLRKNEPDKLLKTGLTVLFPKALAASLCEANDASGLTNRMITPQFRDHFAAYLQNVPVKISKLCPMEKAMAMSGGVSLKEIDPQTMQSRLVNGLFFAGEIMDLTGPCGGYNIQFALSSGCLAGSVPLKKD